MPVASGRSRKTLQALRAWASDGWRLAWLWGVGLLAAACSVGPSTRVWSGLEPPLAPETGLVALRLDGGDWPLWAAVEAGAGRGSRLTVFIEGDGAAWTTPRRPPDDPTPRDPVALRLAERTALRPRAWIARPCQFTGAAQTHGCRPEIWTVGRFGTEVIATLDAGLSSLKRRVGADDLLLVGYSGGATLALALARLRADVRAVITVAGVVDHRAWTDHHGVSPLSTSADVLSGWTDLSGLPQVHMVGALDRIAPKALAEAFMVASDIPLASLVVVPNTSHSCCWARDWSSLEPMVLARLGALASRADPVAPQTTQQAGWLPTHDLSATTKPIP